ncbi:MAG TPA: nuclear transport factor 2 family protein [Pyrinomonadaceae bacterium]|jgi:hypothetical protein
MKTTRFLLAILTVLALASICSAQGGGTGAKASKGGAQVAKVTDESMIIANEQKVLDAIKSRNQAGFTALVDQNGWVVGSRGAMKISAVLSSIFDPSYTITEYRMEDPQILMLDKDAALLSYKSINSATSNGKTESEVSYDSTVWVKRQGKWMAMFHQSTKVENPPAATAAINK